MQALKITGPRIARQPSRAQQLTTPGAIPVGLKFQPNQGGKRPDLGRGWTGALGVHQGHEALVIQHLNPASGQWQDLRVESNTLVNFPDERRIRFSPGGPEHIVGVDGIRLATAA